MSGEDGRRVWWCSSFETKKPYFLTCSQHLPVLLAGNWHTLLAGREPNTPTLCVTVPRAVDACRVICDVGTKWWSATGDYAM